MKIKQLNIYPLFFSLSFSLSCLCKIGQNTDDFSLVFLLFFSVFLQLKMTHLSWCCGCNRVASSSSSRALLLQKSTSFRRGQRPTSRRFRRESFVFYSSSFQRKKSARTNIFKCYYTCSGERCFITASS